jgi:hypothetical protein
MESLRLPQGTRMGDFRVKALIREALLHAAMSAFLLRVDIALLWILVAARRQLLFVPSRASS